MSRSVGDGGTAHQRPRRVDRPKKTAIIVAQKIVHEIINQRLTHGAMLSPEHEMLEELGVGRATLREALRYLELQGVLIIRAGPRGGPMVATPTARQLASTFALLLEMDRTPFADIVAARATLEPLLAAQAALNIDAGGIAALHDTCDAMEADIDRHDVFLSLNHGFHELVAASSGNRVFEFMLSSLHWITDGTPMGVDYPSAQRRAVAAAHRRITEAISSHSPDSAAAAMRDHILEFEGYVSKQYSQVMNQIVHWNDHYL